MTLTDLLAKFGDVSEVQDGGYLALCPAHPDSRPSLRIWRGDDGKARLTCRAGCSTADVIAAVGLDWSALFNVTGDGRVVPSGRPALVGPAPLAALAAYVDATALALTDYDSDVAKRARGYLLDRFGLREGDASELLIGVDAPGVPCPPMPYLSRAFTSYPRVTVPLLGFDGQPRGLQGRDLSGNCPGRWLSLSNPQGHHWAAYGVFRGQGGYGVTIVTEGPGDGLTVAAVGYDAVAVRGASLVASPELVAELAAGLRGTQVIIAGDADRAGRGFVSALAAGLSAHGIRPYALALPDGAEDVTAWRESDPHGFALSLHRAVKSARPVEDEETAKASALSAELTARTGTDTVSKAEGDEAGRILAGLVARYGESDAMNAHALVSWTAGRIKYAPGLGYYVWTGRVWEKSRVKVRQEIHRMGAALVLAGKTTEARGFTMTSRIDALMTELQSVPGVHVDAAEFDARPDALTFRNGTVDLRSGALRQHSQHDMLTYCVDLDYRPDAQCPRWESFLAEVFPAHPELPDYMRRLIGYGITGHTSEQCFGVLWGKGANGKSVFTDTLTAVFRAISKTTPFQTFEEKPSGGIPNDVAALRGSRLVLASEGESGKPMSEGVLKRVTGKDVIAARFLRQEFFEFKPSFLLLLATNHKPRFRGQDEGLWRRVKMIPFQRWFAPHERDHRLDMRLLAEAEGIAAWAVRGAVEWHREGLADPSVITAAGRAYRETSDALAGFLPGVLERAGDEHVLNGSEAFSAYLDWCEAENLPSRERWTRRAFYDAMEERGLQRRKTERGIALVGVRRADASPDAPGPGIFAR
ncbi:phage/plasmid primase, P4 family [Streptacidiphilus sp. P02-A3a]|uniref:phage/plasmid primase, P4 family n=1 Tax=Streptacidiphilus sp. P02-A3a TaxID=2704468 RepID=UPI0015FCF6A3|nr:phage/plasmid primase, P4 family [Streptacidiphilus sp. P02-A3a]QMU72123.1 hypothetical protein GXP74_31680 [Streptacidiphilus sp. P02-A3a]